MVVSRCVLTLKDHSNAVALLDLSSTVIINSALVCTFL